MKKFKIYLFIFFYLLFLLTIYREWIFNLDILTYGDWYYFFPESLGSIRISYFYIWLSDFNLGSIVLSMGQALSWGSYGFLHILFGLEYPVSLRLIHLFPIIFLAPICSFMVSYKIVKNHLAAFVGCMVYCFNTYFLTLHTGHLTLLVVYSIAPIIIYLFIEGLEKKHFLYSILTGVVLSVAGTYEPRAAYQILIIMFFYYAYNIFFLSKNKLERIMKLSVLSAIPVIIFILINSYWILGLLNTGSIATNEVFSRELFGNEFLDIMYAFTLFHPFWTGSEPAIFIQQPIPFYFWITPLLAVLGIIFNRGNKNILFFSLVAILGLLLTKQVSMPFSTLYLWLYNNFPGFNAYREASKFFFYIALSYSILISGFVAWISDNKSIFPSNGWVKRLVVVLVILLFVFNTLPLLTNSINTMFKTRNIPSDYLIFKEKILKENSFSRVLWIPTFSRWSVQTHNHPILSSVEMLKSSWKNFAIPDGDKTEAEISIAFFKQEFSNALLDISSIKYVVVPVQDEANDDNFFKYYGKERDYYIGELDKIDYLSKINLGTEDIIVYENKEYKPRLYITSEIESIKKVVSHTDVDFKFINPTQYTVNLTNITEPVYLNFSESFHPQWKLRAGDFSWYDAITQPDYFVPDKNHSKNDANLNSYYINPEELCTVYECNRNPDGSYSMNVTLYFLPQSYVYVGGIISLTTLLVILGFFGFKLYEKKKK